MKQPAPRRARPFRLAAATAALLAAMASAPAAAKDPQVPGEVLLRLTASTALEPLLARHQLQFKTQFGERPIYTVQVTGGAIVEEKIAALALEPEVVTAEVNRVHSTPEARKNLVWAIGTAAEYAAQWGPDAMRLMQAQRIATGAGVRVAVLDTGVDLTHPALSGKLLPGHDFVDGDADPSEEGDRSDAGYGHGTHVAGLVALAAPDARIMPLRVLDASGRGDVWVLAEAILHAIDPDGDPDTDDGAHVINLSLGTLQRPRVLESVMQLAACNTEVLKDPVYFYTDPGYDADKRRCKMTKGAVIVAAAGNGGNESEKQYPAAEGMYGLLPVGATRKSLRIAKFSNKGSWVDVAAPGDRITSTVPGGYGTWNGTSMAAPLAAGTAALLRERFPDMKAKDVARRIEDHGRELCDANIVQIDALAALRGQRPAGCN